MGHLKQLQRVVTARSNRNSVIAALCRSASWTIHKRLSNAPLTRDVFGGKKFIAEPGGFVANSMMLFGEYYDWNTLKFIESYLTPSDNYLDLGANVGYFTLLASTKVSSTNGKLICVEAGKEQFLSLTANLNNNSIEAELHNVAISDSNGRLAFTRGDAVAHVAETSTSEHEYVEAVRLDELIKSSDMMHLCKLDVEGYELPALRGAEEMLASGRLPVILMEVNGSSERYAHSDNTPLELLKSLGYRFAIYNHDQCCLDFAAEPWDDVVAANDYGIELIRARLPQVRFSGY